jgi:hypothetical protein
MTGIFNDIFEIFGFFIGILIILRFLQIFFYPLFCYSSVRIYNNNNNELAEVTYNSNNIPEVSNIIILNVEDNLIEDKNNNIPIAIIV